jgi:TatD DNase family protein
MIDSHAHLAAPPVIDQIEEILQRAQQHGVAAIVNICTDSESLKNGLLLSKRHSWIFNAAATTPHDVEQEDLLEEVKKEAKNLVAIGETGLDYHYERSPKKLQQEALIRYFELAWQVNLPVIFHCREAFDDLFALADSHYKGGRAVLHCFTGTVEEAKKCLDHGWLISFSGIVTFKKSQLLREVAAFVPLDRLLIETDAPYLAPESKRGKMNEPSYIEETARAVAHVKGVPFETLCKATAHNAIQFFSFPKHFGRV